MYEGAFIIPFKAAIESPANADPMRFGNLLMSDVLFFFFDYDVERCKLYGVIHNYSALIKNMKSAEAITQAAADLKKRRRRTVRVFFPGIK